MSDEDIDVRLRLQGARTFKADADRSAAAIANMGDKARRFSARSHIASKSQQSMQRGFTAVGRAAKYAGGATVLGLGYAIKATIEFDKQLSATAAVTGATGKQLDLFREQALKAGAATVFSAREAAQAQTELAKGGLSVRQIMGGGLDSALALAAAGELELGDAAAYTVNAMKLFGIRGKDSMRVADALATAANKTTADVGDFGLALRQGGAAARIAGLDFNESVSILESLAEAGVKSQDAGTSMKAFFLNIATPSEKAKKAMDQLGLSIFDQEGALKSLPGIARNLRKSFGDLTQKQFTNRAGIIAGSDAIRTLFALYKAGPKTIKKWMAANEKSGTAAKQAAKRQDNLAGQLERLKGAGETFGITVGTMLTPYIREAAEESEELIEQLTLIAGDKTLDAEQKLGKAGEAIAGAFDENEVGQKVLDAFEWAFPKMLEVAAKGSGQAALIFVKGWWHAGIWGKLFAGLFIGQKMGIWGGLGKLGAKYFIRRFAPQLAASLGIEMAAGGLIGSQVGGKVAEKRMGGMGTKAGRWWGRAFAAAAVIAFWPEIKNAIKDFKSWIDPNVSEDEPIWPNLITPAATAKDTWIDKHGGTHVGHPPAGWIQYQTNKGPGGSQWRWRAPRGPREREGLPGIRGVRGPHRREMQSTTGPGARTTRSGGPELVVPVTMRVRERVFGEATGRAKLREEATSGVRWGANDG